MIATSGVTGSKGVSLVDPVPRICKMIGGIHLVCIKCYIALRTSTWAGSSCSGLITGRRESTGVIVHCSLMFGAFNWDVFVDPSSCQTLPPAPATPSDVDYGP